MMAARRIQGGHVSARSGHHQAGRRWAGAYVSNGATIQAALDLGLVVEPAGPKWSDNPNAWIGVGRRSVRRVSGRVVKG